MTPPCFFAICNTCLLLLLKISATVFKKLVNIGKLMSLIPSKNLSKFLVSTILLLSFCSNIALDKNKPEFEVIYQKGINEVKQKLEKLLKESPEIDLVTDLINKEFTFKESIKLVFGGKDGPLFDSGINSILMPYSFLIEVEERFKIAKYSSDTGLSAKEATMDAVMHTIFHELAHALISQYDLPVLGKEEDAADGLASVLLIEYLDEGQEVVISAADLFDLESQDITEYQAEDYWDEHSLDIQRYYSSMCHVYGSSPERYKHIKVDEKFSDEKAENCIDEYEVLVNSWLILLEPYLKNK